MSANTLDTANEPPPVGSRWIECDNRFNRVVVVVPGWDETRHRIRIKNVVTGRITWAMIARFNGKSTGYRRFV